MQWTAVSAKQAYYTIQYNTIIYYTLLYCTILQGRRSPIRTRISRTYSVDSIFDLASLMFGEDSRGETCL